MVRSFARIGIGECLFTLGKYGKLKILLPLDARLDNVVLAECNHKVEFSILRPQAMSLGGNRWI